MKKVKGERWRERDRFREVSWSETKHRRRCGTGTGAMAGSQRSVSCMPCSALCAPSHPTYCTGTIGQAFNWIAYRHSKHIHKGQEAWILITTPSGCGRSLLWNRGAHRGISGSFAVSPFRFSGFITSEPGVSPGGRPGAETGVRQLPTSPPPASPIGHCMSHKAQAPWFALHIVQLLVATTYISRFHPTYLTFSHVLLASFSARRHRVDPGAANTIQCCEDVLTVITARCTLLGNSVLCDVA